MSKFKKEDATISVGNKGELKMKETKELFEEFKKGDNVKYKEIEYICSSDSFDEPYSEEVFVFLEGVPFPISTNYLTKFTPIKRTPIPNRDFSMEELFEEVRIGKTSLLYNCITRRDDSGEEVRLNDLILDKQTILHHAIYHNQLLIVKIILKYDNLLMNVKNGFGNIPLHLAVIVDNLEMVNLLINEDKDTLNEKDDNNKTPLAAALLMNEPNRRIVKALLFKGRPYSKLRLDKSLKDRASIVLNEAGRGVYLNKILKESGIEIATDSSEEYRNNLSMNLLIEIIDYSMKGELKESENPNEDRDLIHDLIIEKNDKRMTDLEEHYNTLNYYNEEFNSAKKEFYNKRSEYTNLIESKKKFLSMP